MLNLIITIIIICLIAIIAIDFIKSGKWRNLKTLFREAKPKAPRIFNPAPEVSRELKPIHAAPGKYLLEQFDGANWIICIMEEGTIKPFTNKKYKTIQSVINAIKSHIKTHPELKPADFCRDTQKFD